MIRRAWQGHEFTPRSDGQCGAILPGELDEALFRSSHGWMMVGRATVCGMPEKAHGVTPAERCLFTGIWLGIVLIIGVVLAFWVVVFA